MPTTIDKTNPEWASLLAAKVAEAKVSRTDKVSDAFAHLGPLIQAVGTTEAVVGSKFRLHALVSDREVFVALSEQGVGTDIMLYQSGPVRLAGAMALTAVPRDRMVLLQANLALLVRTLEDALIAKAQALITEAGL